MYHLPPDDPDAEGWTGRSVHMHVLRGSRHGAKLAQPRLEWSTPGGFSRTGSSDVLKVSLDLLDILSIVDSLGDDSDEDMQQLDGDGVAEENLCFFSITTTRGDVHILEAVTFDERDRIVQGIKNAIYVLSYNLVVGGDDDDDDGDDDNSAMRAFYHKDELSDSTSGELPSLRTKRQHAYEITHAFLDSHG
mmetsp:Transcript_737/g.1726  ORF Transcript_737/g.1726 Transcript_737/m.1726 type:complete len:191 (-) Transcript_737:15-587(-)